MSVPSSKTIAQTCRYLLTVGLCRRFRSTRSCVKLRAFNLAQIEIIPCALRTYRSSETRCSIKGRIARHNDSKREVGSM